MKNIILDFEEMIESVRKDDRIHNYEIEILEVYEDYLHYQRKYVAHPHHKDIEYHLFPREKIGIYKFDQFADACYSPENTYQYYVDMVSVKQEPTVWTAKDLYIDFIIMKDNKYYVADIDEFNDAIKRMELSSCDVKDALDGLNNILKGYYTNFDMETYIEFLKSKYKIEDKRILTQVRE